jgi:hypothetical protein
MEKHINVVAAIRIAFGFLGLAIGTAGFIILKVIGNVTHEPDANFVLTLIAYIALIFFIVISIPGLIAGFGLLKRKEWARILTLIISVIDLFNFPIGTAIGVYCIWALSNNEVVAAFKNSLCLETQPVYSPQKTCGKNNFNSTFLASLLF